jgi:hypothetical protein
MCASSRMSSSNYSKESRGIKNSPQDLFVAGQLVPDSYVLISSPASSVYGASRDEAGGFSRRLIR